jgi:hypothetical protein
MNGKDRRMNGLDRRNGLLQQVESKEFGMNECETVRFDPSQEIKVNVWAI